MQAYYSHLPLIHVFRSVAERGSFQGAATALHLPRSSVSKKVQQLEEVMRQPLFIRSTRKLQLTDFGVCLLERTQHLSVLLTQVGELAQMAHTEPAGRVRITASVLLGQQFLMPLLAAIKMAFPRVVIDLSLNDETVDFFEDGADIALRVGILPDSSLVAKRIGYKSWAWFAAPDYLNQSGVPESPRALTEHACLAFKNKLHLQDEWPFQNADLVTDIVSITPAFCTDNSKALVEMACSGLGIAMLDPLTIQVEVERGDLIPVLTQWKHPSVVPIHLVSLNTAQRSRATNAVWRFLVDNLTLS